MADLRVVNPSSHPAAPSSIFLLEPVTDAGREWIDENLFSDADAPELAWQWWGNGLVIDHGFIRDIVQGAINDGLEVV